MSAHTIGPWQVRFVELHGRLYGLRDVAILDPDAMLCIEGSGGARSYTETVCKFPGTNMDEAHARLIAAAPDLIEALNLVLRCPMAAASLMSHRTTPSGGSTYEVIKAAIAKAEG